MSDDTDLLYGYEAIGKYLQMSERQAKHLASVEDIPTFNLGRRVCSRRSSILAWLSEKEASNGKRS